MKVHYPKLYNMASSRFECFTASKGSNNYFYSHDIDSRVETKRKLCIDEAILLCAVNTLLLFMLVIGPLANIDVIMLTCI